MYQVVTVFLTRKGKLLCRQVGGGFMQKWVIIGVETPLNDFFRLHQPHFNFQWNCRRTSKTNTHFPLCNDSNRIIGMHQLSLSCTVKKGDKYKHTSGFGGTVVVIIGIIVVLSVRIIDTTTKTTKTTGRMISNFVSGKLLRHQPIRSCANNNDCYVPCIVKPCPPIYHCMHGYCKNIKFYQICGTKRICNKGIGETCCNTNVIVNTTFTYCSDGICGSQRNNITACPKISCSTTSSSLTTTTLTSTIRIPTNDRTQSTIPWRRVSVHNTIFFSEVEGQKKLQVCKFFFLVCQFFVTTTVKRFFLYFV